MGLKDKDSVLHLPLCFYFYYYFNYNKKGILFPTRAASWHFLLLYEFGKLLDSPIAMFLALSALTW